MSLLSHCHGEKRCMKWTIRWGVVNRDSSHVKSQCRTVLTTSNAITCLWHCGMRHRGGRTVIQACWRNVGSRRWVTVVCPERRTNELLCTCRLLQSYASDYKGVYRPYWTTESGQVYVPAIRVAYTDTLHSTKPQPYQVLPLCQTRWECWLWYRQDAGMGKADQGKSGVH